MFKRLDTNPEKQVTVFIDGLPYVVTVGETVAAAVLASGIRCTRTTPVSETARAPYCLMGVCYECLMIINGQPNQRACKQTVKDGMRIETQHATGMLPQ